MRIFAGITTDDMLYFLEIEKADKRKGKKYFSMSGFTVKPLTTEEAEKQAREWLGDGDAWRHAVETRRTHKGLEDWIEEVMNIDGYENVIDTCSELRDVYIEDGTVFCFKYGSSGQHEERTLKKYFLPPKRFNALMEMWHKYHLRDGNPPKLAYTLKKLEPYLDDLREEQNVREAVLTIRYGNRAERLAKGLKF